MRLIDADKLKVYRCDDSASRATFDYIDEDDVEDAPTIDLVRCGECKWFYADKTTTMCGAMGKGIPYYGFCFKGERRDDETT